MERIRPGESKKAFVRRLFDTSGRASVLLYIQSLPKAKRRYVEQVLQTIEAAYASGEDVSKKLEGLEVKLEEHSMDLGRLKAQVDENNRGFEARLKELETITQENRADIESLDFSVQEHDDRLGRHDRALARQSEKTQMLEKKIEKLAELEKQEETVTAAACFDWAGGDNNVKSREANWGEMNEKG